VETFGPGDVLNFSIGPGGGGTLVSDAAPWTLVRLGSDLGITSCISAGNDCVNLDEDNFAQFGGEDSGAIIVGAGWSGGPFDQLAGDPPPPFGTAFCRLAFSNFSQQGAPGADPAETPGMVHVQAWGHNVCTLGYGDLVGACEADPTKTYTAQFNGTSAAAPMIAGVVACLQGVAKQLYGVPLTPAQMRDGVLTSGARPQCEVLPQPFGSGDDPCQGDFIASGQPNWIGGFPDLEQAAGAMLAGTFFDGSAASKVTIHKGTLLNGNYLSLRSDDNNYLSIKSSKARVGNKIQGLVYIASGETTDMEVEFALSVEEDELVDMGMQAITYTTSMVAIQALYAFDYVQSRWTLLGVQPVQSGANPDDPDGGFTLETSMIFEVPFPQNHIQSGKVRARVWTVGLGQGGQFTAFHDLVDVNASSQPGVIVIE
jgi:hypothetical protein